MAITSGFFDSVGGDRTYNAEQMSNYFDGLVSDGVYETIGDRFLVSNAHDGMKVNVGSGRAIIRSHWVKNDAAVTLTLDPSDVQYGRYDAVCLRLSTTDRSIVLVVKKGTPSANPQLPEITRTSTVYELYLAGVAVTKGATSIGNILDLRPSSNCGWVTGIVQQVDTSDLFDQWNAAYTQMFASFDLYMAQKKAQFDAWFAALTDQLTVECGFIKYENTVELPASTWFNFSVQVGIPEYDQNADALMVYCGGKFWTEGRDYIQGYDETFGNRIHYIGDPFTTTKVTPITFVVFKNLIGKNVMAPVDAAPAVNGSMLFTIGNAEIDSETVDLLTEPYASHLYNKWFDDNTGQVDDTEILNRVICDLFIDIPDDRSSYTVQAAVSGSAGQFICYFYDANENFLSSQTVTSWVDSSTLKAIPNAKKLRVLMRLSSNADIAIGNISTFKVLFM